MLTSFAWIHGRVLAGSGRPGLLRELEEDLAFIRECEFSMIVTLTQRALERDSALDGIETLHFPIRDMGIPTPRNLRPVCLRIHARTLRGQPVLVHCKAGLGRTGVVLACCLVERGYSPTTAIERLRNTNRYYIQNSTQERFIEHYSAFVERAG